MVGPHLLAKETSLGAASSAGRHPLAGETSLGAASSEASGAGPAPDAFASGEGSLAKGKGPTRAQGVFPGQHHLLPRNSVGIGNRCLRNKRTSVQGTLPNQTPPRIPNFNVAGFFGGLRRCEINAHFARDEVLEQTANIEIGGCGGSSPL